MTGLVFKNKKNGSEALRFVRLVLFLRLSQVKDGKEEEAFVVAAGRPAGRVHEDESVSGAPPLIIPQAGIVHCLLIYAVCFLSLFSANVEQRKKTWLEGIQKTDFEASPGTRRPKPFTAQTLSL